MHEIFRRTSVVLCVLGMAASARAQAPDTSSNPWIHVTRVQVIPGAAAEFEDYIKKIQAGRAKLGLPNPVHAYQVAMGGSPLTFHFVMPFAKWEEMDANPSIPALIMKAYGEAEGAKILKAGRGAIEDVRIDVYRVRLDLSTNAKAGAPPAPFVTLTITEHHGATMPSYLRLLGKIKKAEEQEGNAPAVYRYVLNTGEGAVTVAARPSATLGERSRWPVQGALLAKVYGDGEADEMNELITRTIIKRSSVIIAHRPDLSSAGKPMTPSQ